MSPSGDEDAVQPEKNPYLAHCAFCEQGLVRLMRCHRCQAVAAVCDECELAWDDIGAVACDPKVSAACAYPTCPHCDSHSHWTTLDAAAAQAAGLDRWYPGGGTSP